MKAATRANIISLPYRRSRRHGGLWAQIVGNSRVTDEAIICIAAYRRGVVGVFLDERRGVLMVAVGRYPG